MCCPEWAVECTRDTLHCTAQPSRWTSLQLMTTRSKIPHSNWNKRIRWRKIDFHIGYFNDRWQWLGVMIFCIMRSNGGEEIWPISGVAAIVWGRCRRNDRYGGGGGLNWKGAARFRFQMNTMTVWEFDCVCWSSLPNWTTLYSWTTRYSVMDVFFILGPGEGRRLVTIGMREEWLTEQYQ